MSKLSMNDIQDCLVGYLGGRVRIIDVIDPRKDRGLYGDRSEGDLHEGQPLVRMSLDDAAEAQQRSFLSGPEETTEEQYQDMLDCVPPARYGQGGFAVGEATSGLVHGHYIHRHGRYWHLAQPITVPWSDLLDMIDSHVQAEG